MIVYFPVKEDLKSAFKRQLKLTEGLVPDLEGLKMEVKPQPHQFEVELTGTFMGQKIKARGEAVSPLRAFLNSLENIKGKMQSRKLRKQVDESMARFASSW